MTGGARHHPPHPRVVHEVGSQHPLAAWIVVEAGARGEHQPLPLMQLS